MNIGSKLSEKIHSCVSQFLTDHLLSITLFLKFVVTSFRRAISPLIMLLLLLIELLLLKVLKDYPQLVFIYVKSFRTLLIKINAERRKVFTLSKFWIFFPIFHDPPT